VQDGQVLAGVAGRGDEVALETQGARTPVRPARPTAAAREVAADSTSARSRPTASMNMALWEDRSTPHSIAPPSEPRNHTEIAEHIRCVDPNDPPRAPKSRFVGTSDRSWRVM